MIYTVYLSLAKLFVPLQSKKTNICKELVKSDAKNASAAKKCTNTKKYSPVIQARSNLELHLRRALIATRTKTKCNGEQPLQADGNDVETTNFVLPLTVVCGVFETDKEIAYMAFG